MLPYIIICKYVSWQLEEMFSRVTVIFPHELNIKQAFSEINSNYNELEWRYVGIVMIPRGPRSDWSLIKHSDIFKEKLYPAEESWPILEALEKESAIQQNTPSTTSHFGCQKHNVLAFWKLLPLTCWGWGGKYLVLAQDPLGGEASTQGRNMQTKSYRGDRCLGLLEPNRQSTVESDVGSWTLEQTPPTACNSSTTESCLEEGKVLPGRWACLSSCNVNSTISTQQIFTEGPAWELHYSTHWG